MPGAPTTTTELVKAAEEAGAHLESEVDRDATDDAGNQEANDESNQEANNEGNQEANDESNQEATRTKNLTLEEIEIKAMAATKVTTTKVTQKSIAKTAVSQQGYLIGYDKTANPAIEDGFSGVFAFDTYYRLGGYGRELEHMWPRLWGEVLAIMKLRYHSEFSASPSCSSLPAKTGHLSTNQVAHYLLSRNEIEKGKYAFSEELKKSQKWDKGKEDQFQERMKSADQGSGNRPLSKTEFEKCKKEVEKLTKDNKMCPIDSNIEANNEFITCGVNGYVKKDWYVYPATRILQSDANELNNKDKQPDTSGPNGICSAVCTDRISMKFIQNKNSKSVMGRNQTNGASIAGGFVATEGGLLCYTGCPRTYTFQAVDIDTRATGTYNLLDTHKAWPSNSKDMELMKERMKDHERKAQQPFMYGILFYKSTAFITKETRCMNPYYTWTNYRHYRYGRDKQASSGKEPEFANKNDWERSIDPTQVHKKFANPNWSTKCKFTDHTKYGSTDPCSKDPWYRMVNTARTKTASGTVWDKTLRCQTRKICRLVSYRVTHFQFGRHDVTPIKLNENNTLHTYMDLGSKAVAAICANS